MRSILLAAVLAASSLVTHVQTADACGGSYEFQPTAHLVATPAVAAELTKSFAILWDHLDAKRAKSVKLTQIDTMSFDTAKTAPGRRLSDPTRLTLLGPSGTKIVEIGSTVWVDLAFDHEEAREAVVVPKGDFVIALDGHFKDATWESLAIINGSTMTAFSAPGVQISLGHGTQTFMLGQTAIDGYPLGIVKVKGARYLAVRSANWSNDVWLAKI